MTKPQNIPAIEQATNKTWKQWLDILEKMSAKDLTHKEIAKKLYDMLEGKLENRGWWAQGITVAYEQEIGRRIPGQSSDGTFTASVSKTVDGSMDLAFNTWLEATKNIEDFNDVKINKVSQSKTEKWRNWRVELEDDTKIVVGINQKTPQKSSFGLAHQKLSDAKDVEKQKNFWKIFVEETYK